MRTNKISYTFLLNNRESILFFFPQSILKVNGSCDKSRNVSFSNIEFEVIGYGGEEYSTDEDYSSDDEDRTEYVDSGDDEDLKRLTETNTNINSKLILPEKLQTKNVVPTTKTTVVSPNDKTSVKPVPIKSSSPPLVTVQPFGGEPPKSLVFNFLKNKEIAAATATAAVAAAALQVAKKVEKIDKNDVEDVQLRKTEPTKKTTLSRSSLVANSNEPYLNIKRCSLPANEDCGNKLAQSSTTTVTTALEIPKVKLHPPETVIATVEKPAVQQDNDSFYINNNKEFDVDVAGGGGSGGSMSYKTRNNVPRMGTMHFKLKLACTAQKPETVKPPFAAVSADHMLPSQPPPPPPPPPPPSEPSSSSSLTSREMAGEPDGKADSDEPGDPTTTQVNRSFLHGFKDGLTSLQRDPTVVTPPRTPPKKVGGGPPQIARVNSCTLFTFCINIFQMSIGSNGSSPGMECPRSVKRQAPKPPSPPSTANNCSPSELVYHSAASSFSDDEFRTDDITLANRKLLAEYCEQIEKDQQSIQCNSVVVDNCREQSLTSAMVEVSGGGAHDELVTRESSTLPKPSKRPTYEKKKYGKASKVGLKIKKFLRIPSRELVASPQPQPSPRPKLEIIHPLDINKSGVEIIHNTADCLYTKELAAKGLANIHHGWYIFFFLNYYY